MKGGENLLQEKSFYEGSVYCEVAECLGETIKLGNIIRCLRCGNTMSSKTFENYLRGVYDDRTEKRGNVEKGNTAKQYNSSLGRTERPFEQTTLRF